MLAAPRGIREIAWHLAVVGVLTLVFAVKGGWFVLPWVAIVCWIFSLTPRQLAKVSATYLALGLALAWLIGPRDVSGHLTAALVWTHPAGFTLRDGIIHFLLLIAAGTAAVTVLLSYDRRQVNRRIVDQRVWERQVQRRRQLMRRWTKGRQLPEVLP